MKQKKIKSPKLSNKDMKEILLKEIIGEVEKKKESEFLEKLSKYWNMDKIYREYIG